MAETTRTNHDMSGVALSQFRWRISALLHVVWFFNPKCKFRHFLKLYNVAKIAHLSCKMDVFLMIKSTPILSRTQMFVFCLSMVFSEAFYNTTFQRHLFSSCRSCRSLPMTHATVSGNWKDCCTKLHCFTVRSVANFFCSSDLDFCCDFTIVVYKCIKIAEVQKPSTYMYQRFHRTSWILVLPICKLGFYSSELTIPYTETNG